MSGELDKVGRRDPNAVFNKMVELGDGWADKNAAADLLEEMKKPRLAQLALREMATGNVKSMAQAESRALASPEYQEHVLSMIEARKAANKANVRYRSSQSWLELVRTLEATNRAEMQMSGSQR